MMHATVCSRMTEVRAPSAARRTAGGFSVVELMISIAILTVIMGALMAFMGRLQERYTMEQRVGGVNQIGKTAMELIALDLGQAGYPAVVSALTGGAIIAGASYQNVSVSNTNGMFVNRVVTVDMGINQEAVRITTVGTNSMAGQFKLSHLSNVPVRGSMNPYPQGVLNTSTYQSNATRLRVLGDLRGDGTLRYIEYRFTPDTTGNCQGSLVRSDTDAYAATQTPAVTVADNLCNDATAGVFSYTPTPTTIGQYTYTTNVVVTLQMRTQQSVERGAGGTRNITVRQTFSPRNVMYALTLSLDGLQTVLPVAPGTVLANLPAAP